MCCGRLKTADHAIATSLILSWIVSLATLLLSRPGRASSGKYRVKGGGRVGRCVCCRGIDRNSTEFKYSDLFKFIESGSEVFADEAGWRPVPTSSVDTALFQKRGFFPYHHHHHSLKDTAGHGTFTGRILHEVAVRARIGAQLEFLAATSFCMRVLTAVRAIENCERPRLCYLRTSLSLSLS